MSDKPFSMPFLVDKYLADTSHLSLEEHGAYCLLLFNMWQGGGRLVDDNKGLARMLGASPNSWKKLRVRLEPFFEVHGGYFMQKRLQKQWNFVVDHSIKAKEKASFAAKRRWEQAKGLKSINTVLQAMPGASSKQCLSDAILRKKDIPIPLSTTVALEEGSEQEPSAKISRLLNTNLMRKTG